MKIIQASIQDLELLVPLFDAYRIFYKQESDIKGAKAFLTQRFKKKDSVIFIAIDTDGNGMGFTQLYPSFSSVTMQRTYILNDLYVNKTARNNGVGEGLMERAKEFAKTNNSRGLTLETDHDNPAQRLYERLGWKRDISVNHYTWETN